MHSTTRRTATIAVLALVLGGAGCGGGGGKGDSSDNGSGATAAALEGATHDFAIKMLSGGEGTYDYLSRACQSDLPELEWTSSIAVAMAFVQAFTGAVGDAEDLVGDVETRNVTESAGESRFDLVLPATTDDGTTLTQGDDWIKWLVEDGEWRLTDCENVLSGGSGGDGSSDGAVSSGDDPASLDCDGAPTESEIAPADRFESPTTGSATVRLTDVEEVASPIKSDSYGNTRAKGRFFAVRYEVTNNTDSQLHQFFDIVTALDATDGEAWFEIEDGAASDSLSIEREGEDSTADVEPGATVAGWVVFDVPEDAEIVGIGYRPGFFETTALSLP